MKLYGNCMKMIWKLCENCNKWNCFFKMLDLLLVCYAYVDGSDFCCWFSRYLSLMSR